MGFLYVNECNNIKKDKQNERSVTVHYIFVRDFTYCSRSFSIAFIAIVLLKELAFEYWFSIMDLYLCNRGSSIGGSTLVNISMV
jgi:hypothetical protein